VTVLKPRRAIPFPDGVLGAIAKPDIARFDS
jgi:hypothetical protein